jgi:uncharacterized protein (TIGR02145 family)
MKKIIFMRKLLFPLLAILLFTSCQKQISTDKASEEIAVVAANKQAKIAICHYDVVTGTSKTILVNQNALAAHLAHGDLQGDCSAVITTTICDQVWMVKNLDVDHYRNGDPIPQVTDPTAWASLTTGAWCYYNNDPANGNIYSKYYNWYAVNDPRGLAPVGWHVPSDAEWTSLSNCLGGYEIAGGKMKSTGTLEDGTGLWVSPNTGATNSSGFTGLPIGIRTGSIAIDFSSFNRGAYWWSSTEFSIDRAWSRQVFFNQTILDWGIGNASGGPSFTKPYGMSVRCLRD